MGYSNHGLMEIALRAATLSPDPSTQNGAVLASAAGVIEPCTLSWNEFPRGVKYQEDRWERPLKYSVIEHAERNAIYAAARHGVRTEGLMLVVVWAACDDCARGIIQSGISEVVTFAPKEKPHGEWDASISTAMTMLDESGVTMTYLDPAWFADTTPILRDGKPWKP